jgi:phosphomannomutase
MQHLYDKYGEFVSNNGYFLMEDTSVVKVIFDKITNNGNCDTLQSVGPFRINSFRYLGEPGCDSSQADRKPRLPTSATSPMLTLVFENGCVAQFRGSGTEPKFKYYIEMKGLPGVSREIVVNELEFISNVLLESLVQPSKHGLKKPF